MARNYTTEAFHKRHYEIFADILNEMLMDSGNDPATMFRLENELLRTFRNDNYNFDSSRFQSRAHKNVPDHGTEDPREINADAGAS